MMQESSKFQENLEIKEEPVLALPPLFTRHDDPLPYHFRSYYGEDSPAFRAPGGVSLPQHVVQWIAYQVPKPVDVFPSTFKPEKGAKLESLQRIFAERLIWSSLALQERVTGLGTFEVELVGKLAYMFRTGPFQGLWIRRGYDPRNDTASKKYQAISYSLPPAWTAKLREVAEQIEKEDLESDEPVSETQLPPLSQAYSALCKFAAVPKQTATLQLCDLQDADIQAAVQAAEPQTPCNKLTGWFSGAVWDDLTSRLEARFEALLSSTGRGTDAVMTEADPEGTGVPSEQSTAPADVTGTSVEQENARGNIVSDDLLQNLLSSWPATQPAAQGEGDKGEEQEFEIYEEESEKEDGEPELADEDDEGAEQEDGGEEAYNEDSDSDGQEEDWDE